MRQSGFDEEELNKIEPELNRLTLDRVAAVRELIDQHNLVSAEIAARLLVADFPGHAEAEVLLQEVLAQAPKGVQT
jgi:hypothetical protein